MPLGSRPEGYGAVAKTLLTVQLLLGALIHVPAVARVSWRRIVGLPGRSGAQPPAGGADVLSAGSAGSKKAARRNPKRLATRFDGKVATRVL